MAEKWLPKIHWKMDKNVISPMQKQAADIKEDENQDDCLKITSEQNWAQWKFNARQNTVTMSTNYMMVAFTHKIAKMVGKITTLT